MPNLTGTAATPRFLCLCRALNAAAAARRAATAPAGAPRGVVPTRAKPRRLHRLAEVTRVSLAVHVPLADRFRGVTDSSRDAIHPRLREEHGLRSSEPAKRGVGREVRLAASVRDAHVRNLVRAVAVKQRAVHDGVREVEGVARVVVQAHSERQDATFGVVADFVFSEKRVSLTGDGHVHVSVEHQRHGSTQMKRRNRGADVEKRGACLFPSEPAADAFGLAHDAIARHAGARDEFLVLLRTLRRPGASPVRRYPHHTRFAIGSR